MARRYGLASKKGEFYDDLSDRASELFIFMSLVLNGSVDFVFMLVTYMVIILGTLLRRRVKIDFGFKRFGLFLFLFISWPTTFLVMLLVNSACLVYQIVSLIRTYFS
jgi:phosphatidylglycerophosphate synthase